MASQFDLQELTLAGVAHRCTQETKLFFERQAHDPRYCFELFRRAIAERDQRAWGFIYAQYRPLVSGWVERHSAYPASGEEVQYFVNRAFEKMWAALAPEKLTRFPNLKSLLRYLQMCAHSVILDQVRAAQRAVVDVRVEDLLAGGDRPGPTAENQALSRVEREEFWKLICTRLWDKEKDEAEVERERRVMYGSFALDLKPRELCAHYQDFDDVNEVYRIKQNILARLRRDADLRKLLGKDA
jgi:DNA-directed RNA polymerase specialized sigma24 family protein